MMRRWEGARRRGVLAGCAQLTTLTQDPSTAL
jgi:hypothetical protein